MESLDFPYKLLDLKSGSKDLTKSTLCLKYFRNIVTVMKKVIKNKNPNYKNLFIFAATPSLSGSGRGGGGRCNPPHPLTFFTANRY